jgi:hypothetical protein
MAHCMTARSEFMKALDSSHQIEGEPEDLPAKDPAASCITINIDIHENHTINLFLGAGAATIKQILDTFPIPEEHAQRIKKILEG